MHEDKIINDNGEIEKAGCVVINDRVQILLVTSQDRSAWGLPKGHIENDEDPAAAAKRETYEETGCEVQIVNYIADMTYTNQQTGEKIRAHYYLARPVSQAKIKTDEHWDWVDFTLAKTLVPSNTRELLEKVRLEPKMY